MKKDKTAVQAANKQNNSENVRKKTQLGHNKTARIARQRANQRKEAGTYNSPKIPDKLYEVTVVYHPKLYDQIQELNEKWKKEKKKEIRYATESYCYISKVTEEELSTVREGFASCEIKIRDKKVHPHVMARKWVDTTPKEKKEKKPTGNTAEAKRAAKAKRKSYNLEYAKMRPYYAARRKGGVSKRLSKKNPKLAAAITKWIEEHPATTTRKNRGTGVSAKYKKGVAHTAKGTKRATLASIKTKKRTNLKKAA